MRRSKIYARARSICFGVTALLFGTSSFALRPEVPPPEVLARQQAQFDANVTKTILELQPFRSESQVTTTGANGVKGIATLVNLNPFVGTWYLLSLDWGSGGKSTQYHLESPHPQGLRLVQAADPGTVRLVGMDKFSCATPIDSKRGLLEDITAVVLPYAPLCEGALYVRNQVKGHATSLERATDFLRDHVWGGEKVITLVKDKVYRDKFLDKAASAAGAGAAPEPSSPSDPMIPMLAPESAGRSIVADHLGLDLVVSTTDLDPGRWYAVRDLPAVSVSVIAPQYIDASVRLARRPMLNPVDPVEAGALVYLVAFDTERLNFHYAIGTEHPRLDWSERTLPTSRDPRLPGPDGVGSAAPLVTNGMVGPADVNGTIATFAAGFKRAQGAFHYGPLATQNYGSHYGFIQQGVTFSKLQPELASVLIMDDGTVDLRTWRASDRSSLPHIRDARQNGVPLIEYDAAKHTSATGKFVNLWGPGNWSGSAGEDLRSLRAGLCLQENGSHSFLIYGYFSAATPSTMARVFEAYHCRYAMHLDMNALEHTYLALYARRGNQRVVEHLIDEMQVVDRSARGQLAPRFLAFPDDRDFFYVTGREASP
ncbi:MAG TPA: hypothetical protein VH209_05150 [Steroidobacteraceae bacterium]|nr:hypothetical protein [Steroidobacteraceae bacterium]